MNARQAKKVWNRQWLGIFEEVNDYRKGKEESKKNHQRNLEIDRRLGMSHKNERGRTWRRAVERAEGRWYVTPERNTRSFSKEDWNLVE